MTPGGNAPILIGTVKARRKRYRKPGDVADLRRVLWSALTQIEELLADNDPQMKIKAAHALGTLSGTYLRALELGDLEQRVRRLEETIGPEVRKWA
jgi:hypothetical protein